MHKCSLDPRQGILRWLHVRSVHRLEPWLELAGRALDGGASQGSDAINVLIWNIAGDCLAPVYREQVARPSPKAIWIHRTRSSSGVYTMEQLVECRKCIPCLRLRALRWRMKVLTEMMRADGRTWFGTLTLRPSEQFRIAAQARLRLAKAGADFDTLSPERQFAELNREMTPEFKRFWMRVRKESKAPIRYMLVGERHKSGLPHWHYVLHEGSREWPVRAKVLNGQWAARHGYSSVELVAQDDGPDAASYVAKYLAKEALVRVRASQGYGHAD